MNNSLWMIKMKATKLMSKRTIFLGLIRNFLPYHLLLSKVEYALSDGNEFAASHDCYLSRLWDYGM